MFNAANVHATGNLSHTETVGILPRIRPIAKWVQRIVSETTDSVSIWLKFDPSVLRDQLKVSETNSEPVAAPTKENKLIKFRNFLWDVLLAFIWIYAFSKLFIGDLDRIFIKKFAPRLLWIIDFRFFVLFIVLALLLLFFKPKQIGPYLLYFLSFPVILLFWKIPRIFRKTRSWTLALGSLQLILNGFQNVRVAIIIGAPWFLFSLFALISSSKAVLITSIMVLLFLWLFVLARSCINAFRSSRFVRLQRRLMEKLLNWEVLRTTSAIDTTLQDPLIKTFDNKQANTFVSNALFGVAYYRASQYWAYQLERYRRSGASVFFSAISLMYLMMQGILSFALMNFALFKYDSSQFLSKTANPGLFTFTYYSFSSSHGTEIAMLTPNGSWASALQVIEGSSFVFVIFILLTTIIFGIKQTKSDDAAQTEIAMMRRKGDEFADKFVAQYDTTVDELTQRLAQTGNGILKIIKYFVDETHLPDFKDDLPKLD